MSKKKLHKVFVYGTLREGNPATHSLQDYKLWSLGRFPCITQETGEVVRGNIIKVDDDMLEKLDRYERVDIGLYTRETVYVSGDNGSDVEAFVYVAGNCFPQPIESGDWFIHQGY